LIPATYGCRGTGRREEALRVYDEAVTIAREQQVKGFDETAVLVRTLERVTRHLCSVIPVAVFIVGVLPPFLLLVSLCSSLSFPL
jgi:hypothetical protein